jgi:hypothetical protein
VGSRTSKKTHWLGVKGEKMSKVRIRWKGVTGRQEVANSFMWLCFHCGDFSVFVNKVGRYFEQM